MGCASSTEVSTDPHSGKQKTKTKLGGAYPGNRRTPNAPYQPPPSAFQNNGQATAHFVRYGGGNALVLQQGGIAQPQTGAGYGAGSGGSKQPQYIQVTLPSGVYGGQTIQVQAPDGRLNEIVVPDGFGPGSTFTVEFADSPAPPPRPTTTTTATTTATGAARPGGNLQPYVPGTGAGTTTTTTNHSYNPSAPPAAAVAANANYDDGFASGFGITPNAPATSINGNNGGDYSHYPTATDAKAVYSAPPAYSANPY